MDSPAFPVPDTRPQDSLVTCSHRFVGSSAVLMTVMAQARDLEGLEDVKDFWDMEEDGFDEPKVVERQERLHEESPKRKGILNHGC